MNNSSNDFSYFTAALNAVSSYKNRDGLIASDALRIVNEAAIPTLYNAVTISLSRALRDSTNQRFNGGPAPVASPIAYLDFIQTVMNKICSLARKDLQGKHTEEFDNGIDFTQEHTDLLGFSVNAEHVAELVNEDWRILTTVHARLGQKMPYLNDIPLLRYHARSTVLDDGTWIKTDVADSFEEAIAILDENAVIYAEEKQASTEAEDNNIDFTASNTHPSPEQLKTTGDGFRANVAA
jgi:hypothetical protein